MSDAFGDILLKYLAYIFVSITGFMFLAASLWFFMVSVFPKSENKIEKKYQILMKPIASIWKYLGICIAFLILLRILAELLGWLD